MTRELKLALIVGFSLVLVVTVLISDHMSKARHVQLAGVQDTAPAGVPLENPAVPVPASDPRLASAPGSGYESVAHRGPAPAAANVLTIPQGSGAGPAFSRQEQLARGVEADLDPSGAIRPVEPQVGTVVPAPAPARPAATHTIAEGDSLFTLAQKYYGNGSSWQKIVDANKGLKPNNLKLGMQITVPDVEASRLPKAESKSETAGAKLAKEDAKAKNYTVKSGDTITGIARKQLGSPSRASEVLRLNRSVIEDEDSLEVGTVLKLPLQ